jgi:hypothetical protein
MRFAPNTELQAFSRECNDHLQNLVLQAGCFYLGVEANVDEPKVEAGVCKI